MNFGAYSQYSTPMHFLPPWIYNPNASQLPAIPCQFSLIGSPYPPVASVQQGIKDNPLSTGTILSPDIPLPIGRVVECQNYNNVNSAPPTRPPCPRVPTPYLSRTSFNVGYFVPPSVEPGDPFGGLEIVWTQHFQELFQQFKPHTWYFSPTEEALLQFRWKQFRDFGKVRFLCQNCKHGWTSMHGMVMFYYSFNISRSNGQVKFLLTGQQCTECHSSNFETPMWYPEEARKVMTNLYYTIASEIYNYDTPALITERRHGRPRQQHIASGCQGCKLGICKPSPNHIEKNK